MKQFDVKTKLKVIKKLSNLLVEYNNPPSEDEVKDKNIQVMDPTNVFMVVAKSEEAKDVLRQFIDKDREYCKIPELAYKGDIASVTGIYSTEYLLKAMEIMYAHYETCRITAQSEFPITIENDHFKIIIAPRVTDD